jgi:hypothetical protein
MTPAVSSCCGATGRDGQLSHIRTTTDITVLEMVTTGSALDVEIRVIPGPLPKPCMFEREGFAWLRDALAELRVSIRLSG